MRGLNLRFQKGDLLAVAAALLLAVAVFFLFLPGTNGTDGQGNPKMPRDLTRIGVVN